MKNKDFYWFLQPVAHVKKELTSEEKERLKKVYNVENYNQIINFSYDYLILKPKKVFFSPVK